MSELGQVSLITGLVVAAFVLTIVEVLTPTFGILTVVILGCLGGAVYLAWQLSVVFGVILLAALIVVMPVYVVVMIRWLPKTALGRMLFLRRIPADTGGGAPESDMLEAMIGKTGVAETLLRPSGAVRVDGKRVVALAEGGLIDKGQAVEVIRSEGVNVVVRPIESAESSTAS